MQLPSFVLYFQRKRWSLWRWCQQPKSRTVSFLFLQVNCELLLSFFDFVRDFHNAVAWLGDILVLVNKLVYAEAGG